MRPQFFKNMLKPEAIAELLGTFILTFMGCGAIIVNETTGAIGHLGIALTFGGTLAACIYAFAHISGAHFNPAVTLAFWQAGVLPQKKVRSYIAAQVLGGILASSILLIAFGPVASLGATIPLNGDWMQSLLLEVVMTFVLMMAILGTCLDRRSHVGFAGLAIGLALMACAIAIGPITGASLNPARSIGPALLSGTWQHQWIYLLGPVVGAQLAVGVYRIISRNFADCSACEEQG